MMKKKIVTVCLLLCLAFGAFGGTMSAFADVSLEECDLCFQQTANGMLDRDEVTGSSIVTLRRPLYDLHLQNMGYVYSFKTAEGEGYAIIICDNGNYVAQEFVKSAQSPYAQVAEDELCIYAYTMTYFKGVDGTVCDIQTSAPLSIDALICLNEIAFFYQNDTGSGSETVTVTVRYTAREYDVSALCHTIPQYYNVGWSAGCAAVAGGNLIGYYDRFNEDLIPNHVAGREVAGRYAYYFQDDYVNSAITTLYADMNGSSAGISEDGFKSGMKKYCSRVNMSCDFTSLKSGGNLSFESVKSCIDSGYPLVLFLNTYNTVTIFETDTVTDMIHYLYKGNHVMPGFGYRKVTYTLTNGSKSAYKFVYVATGWNNPSVAYFNIEYSTNIVSAYKVNIH